jgi:holo-[acyl-carrier protein] synthase
MMAHPGDPAPPAGDPLARRGTAPAPPDSPALHGLGIDAVEIDRIEQAVARWGERFLGRVFTAGEIAYCFARGRPAQSLAVRFAAKEAFAKAVPPGVEPTWREVEVVMTPGRKPHIKLAPRLAAVLGERQIRLSLSHTHTLAVAVVLID